MRGEAFEHEVIFPPGTVIEVEGNKDAVVPHKYASHVKEFNNIKRVLGRQVNSDKQKAAIVKQKVKTNQGKIRKNMELENIISKLSPNMKKGIG